MSAAAATTRPCRRLTGRPRRLLRGLIRHPRLGRLPCKHLLCYARLVARQRGVRITSGLLRSCLVDLHGTLAANLILEGMR